MLQSVHYADQLTVTSPVSEQAVACGTELPLAVGALEATVRVKAVW